MRRQVRSALAVIVLGIAGAACAPSTAPSAPASQAPSGSAGSVIATIRVADSQTYRILLTQPDDIATARSLLAGATAPGIPNGRVVRGGDGGVNTGYTWHIDPDDVEWADTTIEVCDGLPSDVEEQVVTSERYCPWSAKVIAVDPA